MNNDDFIKRIEKLIEPLKTGQKRLEARQEGFEKKLDSQSKDIKNVKEDIKIVDFKVEAFNAKLDENKDEITDFIGNLLDEIVTQDQYNGLDKRVRILENKNSTHN